MLEKIFYLILSHLLINTICFAQEELKNSIPLDVQKNLEQRGFEIIRDEKDTEMVTQNSLDKNSSFLIKVKKTNQDANILLNFKADSNVIISEDFEGEFPGNKWHLSGNPTWGKTNYKNHSGSFSGWCAQSGTNGTNPPNTYPNNCSSKILYGPFDLSSSNSSKLCFSFWSDTEVGKDWFFWMASIDGINYYGNGFSGGTLKGTGGSYWMDIEFSLKNVPTLGDITGNSQIWITFLFESDNNSTSDKGVFIDDILLHKGMPEWPTSPGAPLAICTVEGDQTNPNIILNNDGNIFLTWGGTNIYAQQLSSDGFIQFPKNGIKLWNSNYRTMNRLFTKSNSDCYILGWEENEYFYSYPEGYTNNNHSYVQKIDCDGNSLWGENGIKIGSSSASTGLISTRDHWNTDGEGGALFIHQYLSEYLGKLIPYVKRINSSGNEKWSVRLTSMNRFGNFPGKIIPDSKGGAIIAWYNSYNIFAQRVSSNGQLLWGNDGVKLTNGYSSVSHRFQDMVTDGRGGAVILAHKVQRPSEDWEFYIQRINSSGIIVWNSEGKTISNGPGWGKQDAKLIYDDNAGYIIAYSYQDGYSQNIYCQKFDSEGNKVWTSYPDGIPIRHAFGGAQMKIINDIEGGAIISWADYRGADYLTDLYAQRIDSQGNLIWEENGRPVCIPYPWGLTIENFDITSDNEGGAIFAIELVSTYTFYEVPSDIYVQRVFANGDLGIPTYVSDLNNIFVPSEYMVMQNYPNPFNSSTTIKYSLPKTTHVSIHIYNFLGQLIVKLIDKKQYPGNYSVFWDGKNMNDRDVASGIYLYSVTTKDFLKAHKMTLIR